jgi:hypothetical protein
MHTEDDQHRRQIPRATDLSKNSECATRRTQIADSFSLRRTTREVERNATCRPRFAKRWTTDVLPMPTGGVKRWVRDGGDVLLPAVWRPGRAGIQGLGSQFG